MCRPSSSLLRGLFCVLLLGLPATSRAQLAFPADELDPEPYVKQLAKDLFESTQGTARDRAQARLVAARTQMRERSKKYRDGAQDATLDLLLEAAAFLAEAELGNLEKPTPADRLKPLAAHWLYTLAAEQIVEGKYRQARVSSADLMWARHDRLDAEIKLRKAGQKLSEPFLIASLPLDGEDSFVDFDAKEAAKRAFETGRTDLHDLARGRRDAARFQFQVRYENYLAGTQDATLDLLLKSAALLAEAELAALENPTPADRLAPLAAHWLSAWTAEQILEAKYKLGRVGFADVMQGKHARLDAEIKLREAGGREKLSAPLPTAALIVDGEDVFDGPDSKALSKAKFEAGRAEIRDLARARRDAILTSFREFTENRAGDGHVPFALILETARHLLEAELAVHDGDPAERLEAFQRFWEFTRFAENLTQAKYEVGRVSLADYAQARYARLDAEIRMREAREKVKEK